MAKILIILAVICTACLVSADELNRGEVTLRHFHGSTTDDHTDYSIESGETVVNNSAWDLNKLTVIYIHGLTGSVEDESTLAMIEAYLGVATHNVLALDYSSRATFSLSIVSNVGLVGVALGELLDRLAEAGVEPSSIHLIGFGLGPHVAAHAARTTTAGTLMRITALDPALPAFYKSGVVHIEKTDASFVDVIHTDSGILGVAEAIGHVDFYPNSGYALQPGCDLGLTLKKLACSSNRSWYYYAESVKNPKAFPASACDSWNQFEAGSCTGATDYMGYGCSENNTGTFYLQTNSAPPYSRGANGIAYNGNKLRISSARLFESTKSAVSALFG